MKFSSLVLCLSTVCVIATDNRELYGYERACIKSHSITLQDGICNYDAIAKELQGIFNDDPACRRGTNVANELRALWMDEDMSLREVEAIVNSACEEAFYQLTFVEGVSYVDILDDSQQMVKEYFDGRGCVNSDHEYSRAQGLGESILTKVPFQWPGDSVFDVGKQKGRNLQSHYGVVGGTVNDQRTSGANGFRRTSKRNYGPIQNFDQCKLNTAMCCWQESTDPSEVFGQQQVKRETVDHNTDTCYVDMSEAPSSSHVRAGYSIFPSGLGELMPAAQDGGAVRCHGFNWAQDPMHVSNLFKGNALFQTSFQQHLERGGYVSPISGAPMCGCLEQMPMVTRADCTQIDVEDFSITVEISKGRIEVKMPESNKITFSPCTADPDERRLLNSRRVTSAPVTPAPVTPAPVTPEPTDAPGPAVMSLRDHYELMVEKRMIVDKTNQVEKRLVGDGGCPRVVTSFLRSQGIQTDYLPRDEEEEQQQQSGRRNNNSDDYSYYYN